jgi:CubicO group peptidase (beta-lactamase class C family)
MAPAFLAKQAALAYAQAKGLHALAIEQDGAVAAEAYGDGYTANTPHALYSGTKSFWGVTALRAQTDGILQLDETVGETIESWRDEPGKRLVTLRMLLNLTAGFGFGGMGSSVPVYDRALELPLKHSPGSTFAYGGIALQVFGAVLARKIAPRTPHEYLRERVLEPIGVTIAKWRELPDGTHPLPTGAFLSAHDWLRYGRFVMRSRDEFAPCFTGSAANPRYGLGWWLGAASAPDDLIYASGSGGQALYISASRDLVAVHFGKSPSWSHDAFARRLFAAD